MKEKMAADLLPTGEVPIDCLAQPNRPFTICAIHARDRVCQGVIVKVPPTTDTPACNSSLSPRPPVRRGIFQPPSFHLATSKLEMRLAHDTATTALTSTIVRRPRSSFAPAVGSRNLTSDCGSYLSSAPGFASRWLLPRAGTLPCRRSSDLAPCPGSRGFCKNSITPSRASSSQSTRLMFRTIQKQIIREHNEAADE